MCWCAVKKLLTHSLSGQKTDWAISHHRHSNKKTGHSALGTCITGRIRRIDDTIKWVTWYQVVKCAVVLALTEWYITPSRRSITSGNSNNEHVYSVTIHYSCHYWLFNEFIPECFICLCITLIFDHLCQSSNSAVTCWLVKDDEEKSMVGFKWLTAVQAHTCVCPYVHMNRHNMDIYSCGQLQ